MEIQIRLNLKYNVLKLYNKWRPTATYQSDFNDTKMYKFIQIATPSGYYPFVYNSKFVIFLN